MSWEMYGFRQKGQEGRIAVGDLAVKDQSEGQNNLFDQFKAVGRSKEWQRENHLQQECHDEPPRFKLTKFSLIWNRGKNGICFGKSSVGRVSTRQNWSRKFSGPSWKIGLSLKFKIIMSSGIWHECTLEDYKWNFEVCMFEIHFGHYPMRTKILTSLLSQINDYDFLFPQHFPQAETPSFSAFSKFSRKFSGPSCKMGPSLKKIKTIISSINIPREYKLVSKFACLR